MKKVTVCLLILFSLSLNAQETIEILYQNKDYKFVREPEYFDYIDADMDVSSKIKIADYRLTIDKQGANNLTSVFFDFEKLALEAGANSFTIESVSANSMQYIVEVSLYNLNEEEAQENFSFYEQNVVVLIGDLNTKKTDKSKSCKVNGKKVSLLPYTYLKYQNEIDQKIKINIGGILGSSVTVVGEENKLLRCFSLGGISLAPSTGIGHVGVSISTGAIYPVDPCLGLFIMTILNNVDNPAEKTI